ncbi:MAG: preprotein translocase subunit SecE [Saprospirales bacterium]|nr:MAG: preprotein translocase subunit SecE [Saprospirales bacterium]
MNIFVQHIKESYNELVNKVTWPTWPNLLETTRVVIVGSIIITLIVFVMDFVWNQLLQGIYNL